MKVVEIDRESELTVLVQPLINKIDWKITLWACIAFFGLDLDRGNLSQANTDNFLEDLGLGTDGMSQVSCPHGSILYGAN